MGQACQCDQQCIGAGIAQLIVAHLQPLQRHDMRQRLCQQHHAGVAEPIVCACDDGWM